MATTEPNVQVYADYMGAGIIPQPVADFVASDVLKQTNASGSTFRSNPHSGHRPGHEAHRLVTGARAACLAFFDAADEYDVVFTSGCTGALQIAGRSFDFGSECAAGKGPEAAFACSWAAHNSLLGIREIAVGAGAAFVPLPANLDRKDMPDTMPEAVANLASIVDPHSGEVLDEPQPLPMFTHIKGQSDRADDANTRKRDAASPRRYEHCDTASSSSSAAATIKRVLWGFPLECNFSGARFPYREWATHVAEARSKPGATRKVYTLLDAAAAAPRLPISLRGSHVDFMTVSFYKMFGYPTGLGALFIRKATVEETMPEATRQHGYFGGGTVDMSLFTEPYHKLRQSIVEALEAGTPNFHGIAVVARGLRFLCGDDRTALRPGALPNETQMHMRLLVERLDMLQRRCVSKLLALKHSTTNKPLVRLLRFCNQQIGAGASATPHGTSATQGPTVALLVLDDDGSPIGHGLVEKLAGLRGIAIRGGCFCNPGSCSYFLHMTADTLRHYHEDLHHGCSDMRDVIDGHATGALRFSFGYFSTDSDVDTIVSFLDESFRRRASHGQHKLEMTPQQMAVGAPAAVPIKSMHVYPVKGVFGFEASEWPVTPSGFFLDREWMIVSTIESAMGHLRPLSPKVTRTMTHLQALVDVNRGELVLHCRSSHLKTLARRGVNVAADRRIRIVDPTHYATHSTNVEADDAEAMSLMTDDMAHEMLCASVPHPAFEAPHADFGGTHGDSPEASMQTEYVAFGVVRRGEPGGVESSIRGRKIKNFNGYPSQVDDWLSAVLETPSRLVRRRPDAHHPAAASAQATGGDEGAKEDDDTMSVVSATPTLTAGGNNFERSFANSGAFLIVSDASHVAVLKELRSAEDRAKTTYESYRANLVVSTATVDAAFSENHWEALTLASPASNGSYITIRSKGPCTRCPQVGVRRDGSASASTLTAISSLTRAASASRDEATACARPGSSESGSPVRARVSNQAVLGEIFDVDTCGFVPLPPKPDGGSPSPPRDARLPGAGGDAPSGIPASVRDFGASAIALAAAAVPLLMQRRGADATSGSSSSGVTSTVVATASLAAAVLAPSILSAARRGVGNFVTSSMERRAQQQSPFAAVGERPRVCVLRMGDWLAVTPKDTAGPLAGAAASA